MDYEEIMSDADEGMDEAAQEEDFTPDDLSEEEDDSAESLDSLNEDEGEAVEEQSQPQGTSEPGYVQRRIERALARERESIRAEMEAQYAPIRERLLDMDARDLVKQGEFKSIERAKEYLQLKQGIQSAPAYEPDEEPDSREQYAPAEDPATSARIDMLAHQADRIKAQTGIDVIDEFANNEEIKNKVISGEMDLYDVAEMMKPSARRRPPAPTRFSNGASGQAPNAITSMSDEQFERLERRIKEGARYSLK